MKKVLCLLCCLCLILCSCGGDTEPPAEEPVDEKQMGTFYTENGITQNTLVNIIFPEQTMEAPLRKLTYKIRNDSDYELYVDDEYDYYIEMYQDGKWERPTHREHLVMPDIIRTTEMQPNFETGAIPIRFLDPRVAETDYYTGYIELPAGLYRLRIPYKFLNLPADAPQIEVELVAYFTVAPAA